MDESMFPWIERKRLVTAYCPLGQLNLNEPSRIAFADPGESTEHGAACSEFSGEQKSLKVCVNYDDIRKGVYAELNKLMFSLSHCAYMRALKDLDIFE